MMTATLKELGLENVPFPESFIPMYLTVDEDNCTFVHEDLPIFDNGLWCSDDWYEIGIDDTVDLIHTYINIRNKERRFAIVKIVR